MDRAVKAVEDHGHDGPVDRWRRVRDEIHQQVCANAYDPDRKTLTQYYGSGAGRQPAADAPGGVPAPERP